VPPTHALKNGNSSRQSLGSSLEISLTFVSPSFIAELRTVLKYSLESERKTQRTPPLQQSATITFRSGSNDQIVFRTMLFIHVQWNPKSFRSLFSVAMIVFTEHHIEQHINSSLSRNGGCIIHHGKYRRRAVEKLSSLQ
jgi:hypothetical protein